MQNKLIIPEESQIWTPERALDAVMFGTGASDYGEEISGVIEGEDVYFATGQDYVIEGEEDDAYFMSGLYEIGEDDMEYVGDDDDLDEDDVDVMLEALASGQIDEDDYEEATSGAMSRRGLSNLLRGLRRRGGRGRSRGRKRVRGRIPTYRRPGRVAVPRGDIVRQVNPKVGRRLYLGFDSGAVVAAGASANISTQPQDVFSPKRIIIPATLAPSFVVTDIKVGNISQLSSSDAVPAEAFAQDATDSDLKFDTAQVSQQITFSITNISAAPVRFRAAIIGYVARL